MSYVVALFKSLLLMLLVAIPYVVYRWAKINRPARTGVLTGATLGLVVSPVSLGVYLLGFLLPLIGMLPALVGGALTLFHGAPGYELSILLGFLERGVVVDGTRYVWLLLLDGMIWGVTYGLVGSIFDQKLWRYSRRT
jgi:hypothetical protein